MRLRVLMTCAQRGRATSTLWPLIGLPAVSSASAVNFTCPRLLAHEPALMPEHRPRSATRSMRVDDGLHLAVRVVERDLGDRSRRPRRACGRSFSVTRRRAVAVGRERQLVGDELAVARVAASLRSTRRCAARPSQDRAAARTRTRRSRGSSARGSSAAPKRAAARRAIGAAGQVAHLHVDRRRSRGATCTAFGPLTRASTSGSAKLLDAEFAARPRFAARRRSPAPPAAAASRSSDDRVDAELGRGRECSRSMTALRCRRSTAAAACTPGRCPGARSSRASGSSAASTYARPFVVSVRTKCFIDTVSPARSSVRSNTVCGAQRRAPAGNRSAG